MQTLLLLKVMVSLSGIFFSVKDGNDYQYESSTSLFILVDLQTS